MNYAEIALPLPLDKSFHYSIPPHLETSVAPGVRVEVPFGPRFLIGYVLSVSGETPVHATKDIKSVLDARPVVTGDLLAMARWLSGNYICSLGESLAAVVPLSLRAPLRPPRTATAPAPRPALPRFVLTALQQSVVDALLKALAEERYDPFLLHGVTGSGKTEVYLRVIEQALAGGKSAIFLLPEISLTPQFIRIVRDRFPGQVGIWHSNLSAGERYRTWDAARNGTIRIMLGARSAVFAPFEKIGLIIVDEEHESTYKQDQKPVYHTREVALERARLHNGIALLGSATPSLETYFRAQSGELSLLELPERIDGKAMPEVRIVDPRQTSRKSKILSIPLGNTLARVLARREQAILFLNRRGFAPGVMCRECGNVWQCPHCSVSLVYHRDPERLRCHYCDHSTPWPGVCPSCGNKQLAVFGVGTQKVEEELKRLFPQGRVFRLDRDTASRKGTYQAAYEGFKDENYDILLGTQMVTKGFDFPRVTMVGVIDADTALYLPDFRAAERTFQIITQVSGRCGRGDLKGDVVVQSRHGDHYALAAARQHDYHSFYRTEIAFRKELRYPPFTRLANILIRGKNEEKTGTAACAIGDELTRIKTSDNLDIELLGPAPASRQKVQAYFRWQIILKGSPLHVLTAAQRIRTAPLPSGILMGIDIDPQDTL